MRTPYYALAGIILVILVSFCTVPSAYAIDSKTADEAAKAISQGNDSYKSGDYNKALESFMKAKDLLPDDADVLFYIGMSFLKLTETERAADYFQMALEKRPDFTDAQFQLGSAHVIMKEYKEAIPYLEAVRAKEPDRLNLGYMLGLAYYNTEQYDKALDAFEKGKATDKNIVSLNLYYMGLTKVRLGMIDEAGLAYKELVNVDPTSPLAPSSERLMDVLAAAAQAKKKYHVQLTTKFQYDTNAILSPTANIFNLGEKNKSTPVELVFLRGDYSLLQTKDDDLTVAYSFFQTFNNSVEGVDFQDHILSLSELHKGVAWQKPFYLRTTYTYDHALLDYNSYLNRHTIRPSFTLIESPANLTTVQYTLQVKNFVNTPPVPQEDRDAVNNEFGLVHYFRFSGDKHYIYGGYFHDSENTRGSNWDYEGNKFMLGAQYTFPYQLRFNLDYSYKDSDFDNKNSVFGKLREDKDHIVSAVLNKDISKNLSISLEFLYNRNDSTVTLYDFEKEVYSVGAVWRF